MSEPIDHEVHVTLTVAIPGSGGGKHPSVGNAMETVVAALRNSGAMPPGSHLAGDIVARALTLKQINANNKRREKRRAERGY